MKKLLSIAITSMLALCQQQLTANSISGEKNPIIVFEDISTSLLGHITESQFDESYPFSTTNVFFLDPQGNLHEVGDILSLHKDDIDAYVKTGQWIYTPNHITTTTRLSPDKDHTVGTLLLGTTSQRYVSELPFLHIKAYFQRSLSREDLLKNLNFHE